MGRQITPIAGASARNWARSQFCGCGCASRELLLSRLTARKGIAMAMLSPIPWVATWRQALSPRLRRRRDVLSRLSTEALVRLLDDPALMKAHFADPTTYDLQVAIEELARRGIDARPSPGALFDLLASGDERRWLRGMYLFHAAYPACGWPGGDVFWSSGDAPEVWRARLARIPTGR